MTMEGNSTSRNITASWASMKGVTPRVTCDMDMRPTPATTLSTVPTGG